MFLLRTVPPNGTSAKHAGGPLLEIDRNEIVSSHFSSYHVSVKHRPQSTKVDPKKWKEPSACNLEKEKVKASANDSEKTVAKMATV